MKVVNLSKQETSDLLALINNSDNECYDSIISEVKSNIPFFAKCFQEVMDKVVLDAKTEIDNALIHAVVSAGIKVLGLKEYEKGNGIQSIGQDTMADTHTRNVLDESRQDTEPEAQR